MQRQKARTRYIAGPDLKQARWNEAAAKRKIQEDIRKRKAAEEYEASISREVLKSSSSSSEEETGDDSGACGGVRRF